MRRSHILFVLVAVLGLLFALTAQRTSAGFTGDTSTPSTFGTVSDFEVGSLYSWGGTRVQSTPAQVGSVSTWASVAVGPYSDCGIRTDGTLWCSGWNGNGQLGTGDTVARAAMTQVGSATTWSSVGIGNWQTCGLQTDQSLWCWGDNAVGELGDGTTTSRLSPVRITSPSATGWTQLSVGWKHSCALRADTTLWCWGNNANGQLGDNTQTSRLSPTQVTTPSSTGTYTGWTQVAAGDRHTCALRGTGLFCWGNNTYGDLGLGNLSETPSLTPEPVAGAWTAVTSGQYHSCALKSDGGLWCWGQADSGQLGTNTTSGAYGAPAQVGPATGWTGVSAGISQTCGTQSGTLWCWGNNSQGQLGDGTTTNRPAPVQVTSPSATGWGLPAQSSPAYRTCSIRSDSTLWCWGLGYGLAYPSALDANTDWRKPSAGLDYSCAIRSTTELYCWGVNGLGQIGNNTTTNVTSPSRVTIGESSWAQVSAGQTHTCAITTAGALWCWGNNASGRLAARTITSSSTPVQVKSPFISGWTQVTAGADHTCALRTGGALWCWGANGSGQLGLGTTSGQTSPILVSTPAGSWSSVSAGNASTCGRQGTALYCWGADDSGQVGNGTTTTQLTPVQVPGSWQSYSVGASHACGITTAGALSCWGQGGSGRLGNGDTNNRTSPAPVGTATDWQSVGAGSDFTCGVRAGRTAWCWGTNRYGQLGSGDAHDYAVPTQLPALLGRPATGGSSSLGALLIRW